MKELEMGKNGVISEEALEEVAGGMKISVADCKNFLKKNGIKILNGAAIVALAGTVIGLGIDDYKKRKELKSKTDVQNVTQTDNEVDENKTDN